MITRLTVPLEQTELIALEAAAEAEMRPLKEQARLFIRVGLDRAGLLPPRNETQAVPAEADLARLLEDNWHG